MCISSEERAERFLRYPKIVPQYGATSSSVKVREKLEDEGKLGIEEEEEEEEEEEDGEGNDAR
jgi:hypothetical protein